MAITRLAESGSYIPQNAIANRVSAEGGCIEMAGNRKNKI
jgi:hypothetical protein